MVVAFRFFFVLMLVVISSISSALAEESKSDSVAERRLKMMRQRAQSIVFSSRNTSFPKRLEPEPLFRYDDLTRGYVDGTVWRLGAKGRPRAIITTELNPSYGGRPCVIYDFLSMTNTKFRAVSGDVPGWAPPKSAVTIKVLPEGPVPSSSKTKRLFQMKRLVSRFEVVQHVDGEKLRLRLLSKQIDRYTPVGNKNADGAIFLFVSGRMPGMVVLIETDGETWSYGAGRLSGQSVLLQVLLDERVVWQERTATYGWNQPYNGSNAPAVIPGVEP